MQDHILQIDKIEAIINDVTKKTGISPVNISHWDSGEKYQELLMQKLEFPHEKNFSNYIYSYDLSRKIKSDLLIKLSSNKSSQNFSLFSSGTIAISNIILLLMQIKIDSVLVLKPVYYTVCENLSYFKKIKTTLKDLRYDDTTGEYHIPITDLKKSSFDVLWITQPAFSTGVYISVSEINDICKLYKLIILDCSLCSIDHLKLLIDTLPENVIIIGCPHKIIGINGIKFCFVLANKDIIDMLENVGDIFTGSLPATVPLAVNHFLTDNYDACCKFNEQYVNHIKNRCIFLYNKYQDLVEYNRKSIGLYELIKIRPYKYSETINFNSFEKLVLNTFVAYIPNNINNGIKENGYCFRVNYTLDENILLPALSRLFTYFDEYHPEL